MPPVTVEERQQKQQVENENLRKFVAKIKEDPDNYYRILDLEFGSTEVDIKTNLKKLFILYHSDKFQHQDQEIQELARIAILKLTSIKDVLTDRRKREDYDKKRSVHNLSRSSKDSALSEEDFRQFEDLSRKILKVVNKAKKDIPILVSERVDIGAVSLVDTEENLNDLERSEFISMLLEIDNMLHASKGRDQALVMAGRKRFSPKYDETARPHLRLRYDRNIVGYIAEASKGRTDDIDKFITEYEQAFEIVNYYNSHRDQNSLIRALVTFDKGQVRIRLEENYRRGVEGNFNQQLQDLHNSLKTKDKIETVSTGLQKDGVPVYKSYLILDVSEFKSGMSIDDSVISDAARSREKINQLNYHLMALESHIALNEIEEVRKILGKIKEIGFQDIAEIEGYMKERNNPSPLIRGLQQGINLKMTQFLVEEVGFDPSYLITDINGQHDAIYEAAKYCNRDVLEYLYNKRGKPDLQSITGFRGESIIFAAVRKVNSVVVTIPRLRPVEGVEGVEFVDDGELVLGKQRQENRLQVVEFLMEAGCSLEEKNSEDKSPLHVCRDEKIKEQVLEIKKRVEAAKARSALPGATTCTVTSITESQEEGKPVYYVEFDTSDKTSNLGIQITEGDEKSGITINYVAGITNQQLPAHIRSRTIVEVNGLDVSNSSHTEIIRRIQEVKNDNSKVRIKFGETIQEALAKKIVSQLAELGYKKFASDFDGTLLKTHTVHNRDIAGQYFDGTYSAYSKVDNFKLKPKKDRPPVDDLFADLDLLKAILVQCKAKGIEFHIASKQYSWIIKGILREAGIDSTLIPDANILGANNGGGIKSTAVANISSPKAGAKPMKTFYMDDMKREFEGMGENVTCFGGGVELPEYADASCVAQEGKMLTTTGPGNHSFQSAGFGLNLLRAGSVSVVLEQERQSNRIAALERATTRTTTEAAARAAVRPAAVVAPAMAPVPSVDPAQALDQRVLDRAKAVDSGLQAELERCKATVSPVINQEVFDLLSEHIAMTMEYGTEEEKKCYNEQIFGGKYDFVSGVVINKSHVHNLIARLINKRPAAFLTAGDYGVLRDGTSFNNPMIQGNITIDFTEVQNLGKDRGHFCIDNYISYDEMKLAAYLHLSAESYFMNNGRRDNVGKDERNNSNVIKEGVVIGSVGARFERSQLMEWQDMIVEERSSYPQDEKRSKDYREHQQSMWRKFYGVDTSPIPTLDIAKNDTSGRFIKIWDNRYLDKLVYKKMLKLRLAAVFQEANDRAEVAGKPAYVHLVGLGLGVWQEAPEQNEIFYDSVVELLQEMNLPNVSDVDLSWIAGNDKRHPQGQIKSIHQTHGGKISLHNTKHNPTEHDHTGQDPNGQNPIEINNHKRGKLLVQDFAWDGNSFGGNEYWLENLVASGDPAAACSAPIVARGFNSALNPHLEKPKTIKVIAPVASLKPAAVDHTFEPEIRGRLLNLKDRLERECNFVSSADFKDRTKKIKLPNLEIDGKEYVQYFEFGLRKRDGNAYVGYYVEDSTTTMWETLVEIDEDTGKARVTKQSFVLKTIDGESSYYKEGKQEILDESKAKEAMARLFDKQIFANESENLNKAIESIRQQKLNEAYLQKLKELREKYKDRIVKGQRVVLMEESDIDGEKYEVGFNRFGGLYVEKIMPLDPQAAIDDKNRHSHVLILTSDGKVWFKYRREPEEKKDGSSVNMGGRRGGVVATNTTQSIIHETAITDIKSNGIDLGKVILHINGKSPPVAAIPAARVPVPTMVPIAATTPVLDPAAERTAILEKRAADLARKKEEDQLSFRKMEKEAKAVEQRQIALKKARDERLVSLYKNFKDLRGDDLDSPKSMNAIIDVNYQEEGKTRYAAYFFVRTIPEMDKSIPTVRLMQYDRKAGGGSKEIEVTDIILDAIEEALKQEIEDIKAVMVEILMGGDNTNPFSSPVEPPESLRVKVEGINLEFRLVDNNLQLFTKQGSEIISIPASDPLYNKAIIGYRKQTELQLSFDDESFFASPTNDSNLSILRDEGSGFESPSPSTPQYPSRTPGRKPRGMPTPYDNLHTPTIEPDLATTTKRTKRRPGVTLPQITPMTVSRRRPLVPTTVFKPNLDALLESDTPRGPGTPILEPLPQPSFTPTTVTRLPDINPLIMSREEKHAKIAKNIAEMVDSKGQWTQKLRNVDSQDSKEYTVLEALKTKAKSGAAIDNMKRDRIPVGDSVKYSTSQYAAMSIVKKTEKAGTKKELTQEQYNLERAEAAQQSLGGEAKFDQKPDFTARDCKGVDFRKMREPNFRNCTFDENCTFPAGLEWISSKNFSDCQISLKAGGDSSMSLSVDQIHYFQKLINATVSEDGTTLIIPKREIKKDPAAKPSTAFSTTQFRKLSSDELSKSDGSRK